MEKNITNNDVSNYKVEIKTQPEFNNNMQKADQKGNQLIFIIRGIITLIVLLVVLLLVFLAFNKKDDKKFKYISTSKIPAIFELTKVEKI